MIWEYLVYSAEEWEGETETQKYLNECGLEGWELVHISASLRTYIFKRPKEQDQEPSAKPRKGQICYACGYDDGQAGYGMFAGPFKDINECLDQEPDGGSAFKRTAYIIRFNKDESYTKLYKWVNRRWRRLKL